MRLCAVFYALSRVGYWSLWRYFPKPGRVEWPEKRLRVHSWTQGWTHQPLY